MLGYAFIMHSQIVGMSRDSLIIEFLKYGGSHAGPAYVRMVLIYIFKIEICILLVEGSCGSTWDRGLPGYSVIFGRFHGRVE